MMFSFAGTAQEAGAGGRSGAAGIPVHGSEVYSSNGKSTIPFSVYLVLDPQAFVDFTSASSG